MSQPQAEYSTEAEEALQMLGKGYANKAQTIFRVEKNPDNPFVMIDRRPIENPTLSWKAKGLLAYLLSRPDNWTVRFRDLVNRSPDGAHTVRQSLKELKTAGHVEIKAIYEEGRIKEWIYKVYEAPLLDGEFQQVEKLQVENRTFNKNKSPLKKKRGKDIKEATPKPPTPKASDFPELVLHREVVCHWCKPHQREMVVEAIQKINQRLGRQAIKDDLMPFWTAWGKVSGNDWSLVWLTDWAVAGTIPQQKGGQVSTLPKGVTVAQSWLMKKEMELSNG